MRRILSTLGASLALLGAAPLHAQASGAASAATPPFDARLARAVADSVAAAVERTYVYPDTGRLIAAGVRAAARGGAYDALGGHRYLAEALTRDLQAVNGDGHLSVAWSARAADGPARGGGGGGDGARMVRRVPGAPPGPGGPGGPGGVPGPDEVAQARRTNFGIESAERLEGNVGYIELRGFSPFPEARERLEQAMRFLDGTDAMIVDLRRAPGGSVFMANVLISSFTGRDTVHSLRVYDRRSDRTFDRWTLADVPWRRPDVPLYVLTSRGTASAGEDAAFVLKNLGRATIVGERSAGAGHNNTNIPVGNGFTVSVSFSRVYDPRTGAEWEKVGVRPDVDVAPERALAAAHALALSRLATDASPPRRRELDWTREWIEASARGGVPSATALARFPGTYGERVISAADGRLWYQRRADRPRFALVALSATEFAIDGGLRLGFADDASELLVLTPDGESLRFPRAP